MVRATTTPGSGSPTGTALPTIIQGGMGVGVSGWRLARAVGQTGQLGVVSGVALDALLARRLQRGDPGGHLRRALSHFPIPDVVDTILRRYFVEGGIEPGRPFRPIPRTGLPLSDDAKTLLVAGNFAEVYLAKEGHDGLTGINYLEKMQLPTVAAVYGAMLAGVDYVLMGAGIPTELPALLDAYAAGKPGHLTITVEGTAAGERHTADLDPVALFGTAPPVARPMFLAIVSSHILAAYLARDPVTRPDGFVIETPVAGGHSARPRGPLRLDDNGEPVYGPRDEVDTVKAAAVGLPFRLAGGFAGPQGLAAARDCGAAGIQVGSAFALCRESGIDPVLRRQLLDQALQGTLSVRNDPKASPSRFPFKMADLPGTVADDDVHAARPRLCDLGYLRTPFVKDDGRVSHRCAAEPIDIYVAKGGDPAEADPCRCLCNGLLATIGLGQHRADGYVEPPVVTLGQDLDFLSRLPPAVRSDYCATDVIGYLLGG